MDQIKIFILSFFLGLGGGGFLIFFFSFSKNKKSESLIYGPEKEKEKIFADLLPH